MTPTLRTGRDFDEVLVASELSEEALALYATHQEPGVYVDILIQNKHYVDTIRLLAHALPKRETVWWAWACASKVAGEASAEVIQAALDATRDWIADPTDEHSRHAMEKAQEADIGTAAGCAALSAFLSGNSLAPPEVDPVVPGEFMGAKAVVGSVIMAAISQEPDKADEKYQAFIEAALDVAAKVNLFQPPDETEARASVED